MGYIVSDGSIVSISVHNCYRPVLILQLVYKKYFLFAMHDYNIKFLGIMQCIAI